MSKVMIGAHKGVVSDKIRENSIQSINRARELGYDYVEIDLRFTADSKIVLFHDETIETGGKVYKVSDLTYSELNDIEAVCLLDDVLSNHELKEYKYLLEIKPCSTFLKQRTSEYCEKLYWKLIQSNMLANVIVFTIDYDFLDCMNRVDLESRVKTGLIASAKIDDPCTLMKRYRCNLYLAYIENLTEEMVNKLHSEGYIVSGSIVNMEETYRQVKHYGLDMFETDLIVDLNHGQLFDE